MNKFAIFILTYNRPKKQITLKTLRKQGYTGDIYAIVDNTDTTINELKKEYGDDFKEIIIFNKEEYYKKTDTMDNFHNLKSVVYARNFCLNIAKQKKLDYFAMVDDDIKSFFFRIPKNHKLISKKITNFDKVVNSIINFLKNKNIYCLSFGNAGSYIGGLNGKYKERLIPGSYGIYFLKKENIKFKGTSNEDVIFWNDNAKIGRLCYLVLEIGFDTYERGSNSGGLSEMYEEIGTYVRSFYAVIANPSTIKLYFKKNKFEVKKETKKSVPKLLNEVWKK